MREPSPIRLHISFPTSHEVHDVAHTVLAVPYIAASLKIKVVRSLVFAAK